MSRWGDIFSDDNPLWACKRVGQAWRESPLIPALSPLSKGGEGAGVGGFHRGQKVGVKSFIASQHRWIG